MIIKDLTIDQATLIKDAIDVLTLENTIGLHRDRTGRYTIDTMDVPERTVDVALLMAGIKETK